jgi:hypothetical protein
MPIQSTLSPAMGGTCGRREREADAGTRKRKSSCVVVVATVEGTPIHGMPVAFAGCRWSVGLGRSVMSATGLVPMQAVAPATGGCPLDLRGGERRQRAPKRPHSSQGRLTSGFNDASRTRPSLSPETRARQSPLPPHAKACGGGAVGSISRSGKPAQAGGTGTGVESNGRSAARRVSPLFGATREGRA